MVGASDHEASLYHPAAKVDIGVQVELQDALPDSEAGEDNEESVEAELDHHVQIAAQPVASEADLRHDKLDAMDMGDVEYGVHSDFEFDIEAEMLGGVSVFHKEMQERKIVKDDVIFKAFYSAN